ncbi:MAG: UxaA family hydrolase [Ideonella sp.]|nr:UxaA family hydrolase [Ideonella sp.]MCC7457049.1 UxaA family hydrolase [Nitrospira sp.]
MAAALSPISGYARSDGRKGIRNVVAVAYLVECAHHVARRIVDRAGGHDVHLIGFGGCYPNAYAARMMQALATHPNVGAVLLVSLGCESFDRRALAQAVAASGRPVHTLVIQHEGGTARTIERGAAWVGEVLATLRAQPRVPMGANELVIGTVCGGSDGTSGISANPAVGRAFDRLGAAGAACIFEETGELVGCEHVMAARAASPALGREIVERVEKAARCYAALGQGSFALGNAEGGLTTIEEKSLGAYAKSGAASIVGVLEPGERPPAGGLYLLDVVADDAPRFGFPNINDNAEIAELMACGALLTLFTTGRGSVVGSALAPVIKVCANPDTWRRMADDMDIDAGRILEGCATLDEVGSEIVQRVLDVANGAPSRSEALGHQEFVLTYKSFAPRGPACLPA